MYSFLNAKKKREGIIAEQVYFSVAAGISMIFATAIAFSFQQRYGNFTMPFFVALVVSYMLKDRIKELFRYYFAHKHRSKYFDNKTTFGIGHNQIGWSREGFDFISQSNILFKIFFFLSGSLSGSGVGVASGISVGTVFGTITNIVK